MGWGDGDVASPTLDRGGDVLVAVEEAMEPPAGSGNTACGTDAAAPSTGGGYTLTAGFVPGLGGQNEAPVLNIEAISPGQVKLAWEALGVDYVLQQAATLDPGAWVDIPAGGISPVVLTALESGKFYRLRRR